MNVCVSVALHFLGYSLTELSCSKPSARYWQQLLLHALPGTASTISLGGHHSDESDARQWRQVHSAIDASGTSEALILSHNS